MPHQHGVSYRHSTFFERIGLRVARQLYAVNNFFQFIGHLLMAIYLVIACHLKFNWSNYFKALYHAGVRLVVPLILLYMLTCFFIVSSTYNLINKFRFQHQALVGLQYLLSQELLPFMLAIFVCMHAALDLINKKVPKLKKDCHAIIIDNILPSMLGSITASLLLYFYCFMAIMFSLSHSFILRENTPLAEFINVLSSTLTLKDILDSIYLTLTYTTIASIIVSYYHYLIASIGMPRRICVSRILTRGPVWVLLFAVYFNLLSR